MLIDHARGQWPFYYVCTETIKIMITAKRYVIFPRKQQYKMKAMI